MNSSRTSLASKNEGKHLSINRYFLLESSFIVLKWGYPANNSSPPNPESTT